MAASVIAWPVRVVGRAADEVRLRLERRDALPVQPGHDLLDLAHHLGADAVAGQEKQVVGRHRKPSSWF